MVTQQGFIRGLSKEPSSPTLGVKLKIMKLKFLPILSGQLPLLDMPAGSHGSSIHHLRLGFFFINTTTMMPKGTFHRGRTTMLLANVLYCPHD